jgi:hypothetical protein
VGPVSPILATLVVTTSSEATPPVPDPHTLRGIVFFN